MNVLIACEESQRVCTEFRKRGHNAFSCDIIKCSGGHPEWHIKGDVLKVLNPNSLGVNEYLIEFQTQDGSYHCLEGKWDLIIAHPPCTYLTNTGNRWFNVEKYGDSAKERLKEREKALNFVQTLWSADCEKMVVENPVGYLNTHFMKPTQIVHPYYFAEEENDENCERKATCLFERGVEPLKFEIRFAPRVIKYKNGKGTDSPWHMETMKLPPAERARERSKTYLGIAKAMAEQWG